jgi:hypothetical protein
MTPPGLLFAAAALVPAMFAPSEGSPQLSLAGTLAVALCNGGSMVLPLGSGAPAIEPCCCAKGCRSEDKRRRIDRKKRHKPE